jgi:hypothetical protein
MHVPDALQVAVLALHIPGEQHHFTYWRAGDVKMCTECNGQQFEQLI